jgi:hypothetical protein
MARGFSLVWMVCVTFVAAALLHAVDAEVGGLEGLADGPTMMSVLILTAVWLAFPVACLLIWLKRGPVAFAWTVALVAVAGGLVGASLGSTADTFLGRLWSFLGLATLAGLALVLAVLPARRSWRQM